MDQALTAQADTQYPLTANAVVARTRLIQEVMKAVMKKDTHYGTIPGTPKPTLYKPGAEVLLVTFRIAPDSPEVQDLSTGDSIRYRVIRRGLSNGQIVAAGVGEASSDEEKYKWRKPTCEQEYDATPEDRRRAVWKRGKEGPYELKQVRTNPADVANTILKMADKRAFVAMTLLATAASDCFAQDLEDLPDEVRESVVEADKPKTEPIKPPAPKKSADPNALSFVPKAVSTKSGEGEKGPWTKYGILHPDGASWYSTFDSELGEAALLAKEKGQPITITFKDDGKYKTVITLTA